MSELSTKTLYTFLQSYSAINRDRNSNESKVFQQGTEAVGEPYVPAAANSQMRMVPSVLIEDKYIVPASYLKEEEKIITLPKSADIKATASSIKNNKGFRNGAIAGGVAGLGYALIRRKNLVLYTIIGLMGGATVGYLVTRKKDPTKNSLIGAGQEEE